MRDHCISRRLYHTHELFSETPLHLLGFSFIIDLERCSKINCIRSRWWPIMKNPDEPLDGSLSICISNSSWFSCQSMIAWTRLRSWQHYHIMELPGKWKPSVSEGVSKWLSLPLTYIEYCLELSIILLSLTIVCIDKACHIFNRKSSGRTDIIDNKTVIPQGEPTLLIITIDKPLDSFVAFVILNLHCYPHLWLGIILFLALMDNLDILRRWSIITGLSMCSNLLILFTSLHHVNTRLQDYC